MAACLDTDLKKKMRGNQRSHCPVSELQDDILGRGFEAEAVGSSCTGLRLHRLCTGLVSRMLGPCSNNTCWSGGGLDPGSHRGV